MDCKDVKTPKEEDLLTNIKQEQPDGNIKEKLTLHIKRRQQETPYTNTQLETKKLPSNSAKSPKKSKTQKLNSIQTSSTENVSNYENESETSPVEKTKTPDFLTAVLNKKKRSLLNDPEIMKFLDKLTEKKKC